MVLSKNFESRNRLAPPLHSQEVYSARQRLWRTLQKGVAVCGKTFILSQNDS